MFERVKPKVRHELQAQLGRSARARALAAGVPGVRDQISSDPAVVRELHLAHRVGYNSAPIDVEVDASPASLERMTQHVEATWSRLGSEEPFWSVISWDEFKTGLDVDRSRFYDLGESNVDELSNTLRRNGVEPETIETCLEFGCGVGRVTWRLAEVFSKVIGVDISQAHLDVARTELDRRGIDNVDLVSLQSTADVANLAGYDLVYSTIVLQHNPPPVMKCMLSNLLGGLRRGGVAVFQVPTYRAGYRFSVQEYLGGTAGVNRDIEMHVLPQHAVFSTARDAGCDVLEVFEDAWTGLEPETMSNTFVCRKV